MAFVSLPPGLYRIGTADDRFVTAPAQVGNSIFVNAPFDDEAAGLKKQIVRFICSKFVSLLIIQYVVLVAGFCQRCPHVCGNQKYKGQC
jgi:hypothetical protein